LEKLHVREKLTDTENNSSFGGAISLSADYLLVSAPNWLSQTGAASIYYRLGSGWIKLQRVADPHGTVSNLFGEGIAIDASTGRFFIGSSWYKSGSGCAIFGKIE
jgi:hypothetical protein